MVRNNVYVINSLKAEHMYKNVCMEINLINTPKMLVTIEPEGKIFKHVEENVRGQKQ